MANTGKYYAGALLFSGLMFLPLLLLGGLAASKSTGVLANSPANHYSGTTEMISGSSAGDLGDEERSFPSISADGRFVAFASSASWLVNGDTKTCEGFGDPESCPDVFLFDRQTAKTTLISKSSSGVPGNAYSGSPVLSANGRFIAFISEANNLVEDDTNGMVDVFVYDRQNRLIQRVSASSTGIQANLYSHAPLAISASGRYVAFSSSASNLVKGDMNSTRDVFVHDRLLRITELVSISSNGEQGNSFSGQPSISADGRFVAFISEASNLVSENTNLCAPQKPCLGVYVHDRQTRLTERVSVSSVGEQGNQHSHSPSISRDGRFVAFVSLASNLVIGDTNDKFDVFVRDRLLGITERVSVSTSGEQGYWSSGPPSISDDGWFVAFSSEADNLLDGETEKIPQIYIRDRLRGLTERISVSSTGEKGNWLSESPSISASGRYIVFASEASNLVEGDLNGTVDIFVRDRCIDGTCTAVPPSHSFFLPVIAQIP
jgi:Tol biopolymer transport system component